MLNPTLFIVMGKWYLHLKNAYDYKRNLINKCSNKQMIVFVDDESSFFHDHMTMCLLHDPRSV
jgi:hypothetical protein